jgi:hypothetical protein
MASNCWGGASGIATIALTGILRRLANLLSMIFSFSNGTPFFFFLYSIVRTKRTGRQAAWLGRASPKAAKGMLGSFGWNKLKSLSA